MRRTIFFALSLGAMLMCAMTAKAQEDIVRKINEGGKFDKW